MLILIAITNAVRAKEVFGNSFIDRLWAYRVKLIKANIENRRHELPAQKEMEGVGFQAMVIIVLIPSLAFLFIPNSLQNKIFFTLGGLAISLVLWLSLIIPGYQLKKKNDKIGHTRSIKYWVNYAVYARRIKFFNDQQEAPIRELSWFKFFLLLLVLIIGLIDVLTQHSVLCLLYPAIKFEQGNQIVFLEHGLILLGLPKILYTPFYIKYLREEVAINAEKN